MSGEKVEFSPMLINFFGQVVTITTTQSISSTILTDQGPIVETYPLQVDGVLIDEDEDKYYLGKTIHQIDQNVEKSQIVGMKLYEEPEQQNFAEEILNEFPVPEKDEEIN